MKSVSLGTSLQNALNGFVYVVKNERNFSIQIVAGAVAILGSIFLRFSLVEIMIIALLVIAVLVAEIFNSAIEKICDLLKPRLEERVRVVKDIAAAAVLLVSFGSVVVGVILLSAHVW